MKPPLQYVFLDTQVFRKERFQWDSANFQALKRRVEAGSVVVLSTPILAKELRRQVQSIQNEFIQAITKANSLSGVSKLARNSRVSELSGILRIQISSDEVIKTADRILSLLHATELPLPADGLQTLFDWYFNGEAPFGVKGKKSEFPDAANKLALLKFAREKQARIAVVSDDGDWQRTAEQHSEFQLFERIEQFLDIAIKSEFESRQFWSDDEILETLKSHTNELKELIVDELLRTSQVNLGDGKIESLKLKRFVLEDVLVTDVLDRPERIS
jgi:hypothetical protein